MIQLYYMSSYITTNIRIEEHEYLRLKEEAFKKRKSLSSVIREKLRNRKSSRSKNRVKTLMKDLDNLAHKNAKYLKNFDSLKALREIRNEEQ